MSKAFSASVEIIIWFLFFNLLMWSITLINLWILKNPCIPGIKPTWSCYMIFLICWILFARIVLRIFAEDRLLLRHFCLYPLALLGCQLQLGYRKQRKPRELTILSPCTLGFSFPASFSNLSEHSYGCSMCNSRVNICTY